MSQKLQTVQVVIVNFERPKDTLECIQSVLASKDDAISVVVVDNGSKDDSVDLLTRAGSNFKLICLPTNLGYAGGYNVGIEDFLSTDTEYLFILNNDTVIKPATIATLVKGTSQWDVAVPKIIIHGTRDLIWAAGARWRFFPPSVVMRGYKKRDEFKYDVPCSLDYATGCALMLRRKVVETIGGFDPSYQNYQEDYDLCFRIRAAGFSIGYVPTARLMHKVSLTMGEGSPHKWQSIGRNMVLFYRKEKRFPTWMLWSTLFWITARESLKCKLSILPHFWQGVREGFTLLNQVRR